MHGTFLVKAGFDLHKDFSVDVRPNEIDVRLPAAQILGVEEQKVDVLAYENGYWNRISAKISRTSCTSMPQLAQEKATQANLTGEAERTLKEQLEQKIKTRQPVQVRFGNPLPETAPTR